MTDLATRAVPQDNSDDAEICRYLGLDPKDIKTKALLRVCAVYGLDPLRGHVIVLKSRIPYITRDGLLHVAHRSGQFDGIEILEGPVLRDGEWHCRASVWRRDWGRAVTYPGRYSAKGQNAQYAPEMAITRAECMALRRAFDVTGIAVADEINQQDEWRTQPQVDIERQRPGRTRPPSNAEVVAAFDHAGVPKDLYRIVAEQLIGREVEGMAHVTGDELTALVATLSEQTPDDPDWQALLADLADDTEQA